ncbi:hypothetical protein [Acidithiobacillus albertensis]|uniref:hypothetical protein n=1 Tax=Acidithiobacillus albertensis TaxID=119978 RepID=UPI00094A9F25|nr:hypothetical protein [Acidithiobacillus albertensis]
MEYSEIMQNIKQAKAAQKGSGESTILVHGGIAVEGQGMSALFAEKDITIDRGSAFRVHNPEAFMRLNSLLPNSQITGGQRDSLAITANDGTSRFKLRCAPVVDYKSRLKKTDRHIAVDYPKLLIDALCDAGRLSDRDVLVIKSSVVSIGHGGALAVVISTGQAFPWPVAFLTKTTETIAGVWSRRSADAGFISPSSLLVKGEGTWTEFRAIEDPDQEVVSVPKHHQSALEFGDTMEAIAKVPAIEIKRNSHLMALACDVDDVDDVDSGDEKSRKKRKSEKVFNVSVHDQGVHFRTSGGETSLEHELSGSMEEAKFNASLFNRAVDVIASRCTEVIIGTTSLIKAKHIILSTEDRSAIVLIAGLRD